MTKLAIVTGGTRGIGASISIALKNAGYKVIANYKSNKQLSEEFASKYSIHTISWDVASFEECAASVQKIESDFGASVSVLINNAGVIADAMLHKMPPENWSKVIETNLNSCFNMCHAVIPSMRAQNYGRIINISSINALAGQIGQTNYCAAKAGMIGFAKALARENANKNITVNSIAPGYVSTDMTRDIPSNIREKILDTIPIRRFAEPEEISRAALFLADDNAGYITGQTISVNGGQHMD